MYNYGILRPRTKTAVPGSSYICPSCNSSSTDEEWDRAGQAKWTVYEKIGTSSGSIYKCPQCGVINPLSALTVLPPQERREDMICAGDTIKIVSDIDNGGRSKERFPLIGKKFLVRMTGESTASPFGVVTPLFCRTSSGIDFVTFAECVELVERGV